MKEKEREEEEEERKRNIKRGGGERKRKERDKGVSGGVYEREKILFLTWNQKRTLSHYCFILLLLPLI